MTTEPSRKPAEEHGEVDPASQVPAAMQLMAGLVAAYDWFDNGLQNALESIGRHRVHRTQSMILVHIARGIVNPADIAREMGSTRQNIHHMARALIDAGLIEQARDPRDPRRTLYRYRESAASIRSTALGIIAHMESLLVERIGAENVARLREILSLDWGEELQQYTTTDERGE